MSAHLDQLHQLYKKWSGQAPTIIKPLPPSGSNRTYYRLGNSHSSIIGTFGANNRENEAFFYLSQHFTNIQLPVPELYIVSKDRQYYLQEDIGDYSLYQFVKDNRKDDAHFPETVKNKYQQVLRQLIAFQMGGEIGLDYHHCYPRGTFDHQSILWDLNYFKYYFLKLIGLSIDEQLLEVDFYHLIYYLLEADCNYFLYRDFQSRNIHLKEDQLYFIDFQGGRKGARQYDVVSLLYQSSINMPQTVRDELLDYYMEQLSLQMPLDQAKFRQYFNGYLLIRLLQVLGAYGFRGLYEKKPYFLNSIVKGVNNLSWFLENIDLPIEIPHLKKLLHQIPEAPIIQQFSPISFPANQLTITVNSFSYKRAIPDDLSGNGGGFVFDCRAVLNPYRDPALRKMTGRDEAVKEFLKDQSKIDQFLQPTFDLVEKSVQRYLARNFTSLSVSFGCTGGQHRSVYCADRMADFLREKYEVNVVVRHIEQEIKGWVN